MKFERLIGDRRVSVARLYTDGAIEVNFGHLPTPFNDLAGWRELAGRLQRIEGVTIPPERLGRFPTFPIRLLRRKEQLARFTETIEWAFGEIERATTNQSPDDGIASPQPGSGATSAGRKSLRKTRRRRLCFEAHASVSARLPETPAQDDTRKPGRADAHYHIEAGAGARPRSRGAPELDEQEKDVRLRARLLLWPGQAEVRVICAPRRPLPAQPLAVSRRKPGSDQPSRVLLLALGTRT
jgi:hypothetical protein